MTCGSCGATIADKAIVCYRCGAATAIPAAPVRPATAGPPMALWAAIGALGAGAVVAAWYFL